MSKKHKKRKWRGSSRGATSTHHIIPKSKGGIGRINNTVELYNDFHEAYHFIFGNLVPEEIVEYLNRYFWGNQFDITIERRKSNGEL